MPQARRKRLYLDFETSSDCDLVLRGAYRYARHASTKVLMMGWAIDDGPVQVLEGEGLRNPPKELLDVLHYEALTHKVAFNAQFERLIYTNCLKGSWPKQIAGGWNCVQAQARAAGLPGSLANVSYVLNVSGMGQRKMSGASLIRLFSINQTKPEDAPEEWEEFKAYCKRDVEVTRAIHKKLTALTETAENEYIYSEMVNDRGIEVDVDLAEAAASHADYFTSKAKASIYALTNGACRALSGSTLLKWILKELPEDKHYILSSNTTKSGFSISEGNLRKLHKVISPAENENLFRVVHTLVNDAPRNALSKFRNMYFRADERDNRVRGSYKFNGASTGRFSSHGLQLQNFPRDAVPTDDRDMLYAVKLGDSEVLDRVCKAKGAQPLPLLKGLVRSALKAKTHYTFVGIDYAQIEGRIAPWLSGEPEAQDKLDAYADETRDVYCETAEAILGRKVEKGDPERQSYGKTSELALIYGGATGALQAMANAYDVEVRSPERVVRLWREANRWATEWHGMVKDAAFSAVESPLTPFPVGKVSYQYIPDYLRGSLQCTLPSGRVLNYPFCSIKMIDGFATLVALHPNLRPKTGEKGWPLRRLWHGLLCENITQATAACLLRANVVQLSSGLVAHTHDDLLFEVPEVDKERRIDLIKRKMLAGQWWTKGLPLAVDYWIGSRFRK